MNTRLLIAVLIAASSLPSATAQGAEKKGDEAAEPARETVMLGQFMMRDFRVTEGTKIRLSFDLYAEIDPEQSEWVNRVIQSHRHRIRNEVITAVRTTHNREFHEADLERFRKRVLLRLRRAAPYLPIERLLIGEFELMSD